MPDTIRRASALGVRLWRFAAAVAPLFLAIADSSAAATFTVSNRNDSGSGSLRLAIEAANGAAGADLIRFQIGGSGVRTITLVAPLPAITDAVTIDGTTVGGYGGVPNVEINAAGLATGITVSGVGAGGTTLIALAINRFTGAGILVDAAPNVTVRGCHVGTNPAGTAASRASNSSPVGVELVATVMTTIGGTGANDRAVISGNAIGVRATGGSGLSIAKTFVGTNAAGTAAIPNDGDGIEIEDGFGALIGGTDPARRNVISGNGGHGIRLAGVLGGAPRNHAIRGNYIGVNAAGTAALANAQDGVHTEEPGCEVGGTEPGARNVISGNGGNGVRVTTPRAVGTFVRGNFIGTAADGLGAIPNGFGVTIESPRCFVGGLGAGNVISGNLGDGLAILASTNTVSGNLVGTDSTGSAPLPNGGHGIRVTGPGNRLGGAEAFDRNVVAANGGHGIWISGAAAIGNIVDRALVGVGATGFVPMGNGADGIRLESGSQNFLGNSIGGAGNVIGDNGGSGVSILGSTATLNQLAGNRIGVGADGFASVGNAGAGIRLEASGNFIGIEDGPNEIAHNGAPGVEVVAGANNSILYNSIFANHGLGIDLSPAGINQADTLDLDVGPNELQNAPRLLFVLPLGETLVVGGTLTSRPLSTYRVQFFADAACLESAPAEGRVWLGESEVATDAKGVGNIYFTYPHPSPEAFVVATATDAYQNTSEFSACLGVGEVITTGTPPRAAGDRLVGPDRNPFFTATSVRFQLAAPATVSLHVLDARGRRVATLAEGDYARGEHAVAWNASSEAAGVYWCRLTVRRPGATAESETMRVICLR